MNLQGLETKTTVRSISMSRREKICQFEVGEEQNKQWDIANWTNQSWFLACKSGSKNCIKIIMWFLKKVRGPAMPSVNSFLADHLGMYFSFISAMLYQFKSVFWSSLTRKQNFEVKFTLKKNNPKTRTYELKF